jgi:hypothetical protein
LGKKILNSNLDLVIYFLFQALIGFHLQCLHTGLFKKEKCYGYKNFYKEKQIDMDPCMSVHVSLMVKLFKKNRQKYPSPVEPSLGLPHLWQSPSPPSHWSGHRIFDQIRPKTHAQPAWV